MAGFPDNRIFCPACPQEIATPVLHSLVNLFRSSTARQNPGGALTLGPRNDPPRSDRDRLIRVPQSFAGTGRRLAPAPSYYRLVTGDQCRVDRPVLPRARVGV